MQADPLFSVVLALQEFAQASDRYVEAAGARHGTHRRDLQGLAAILHLERSGLEATPGALARTLSLSPPATSALLARLERHGHVERVRSASDRRSVRVVPTAKAREDGRAVFGPLAGHLAGTVAALAPDEAETVLRFLADATAAVDRAAAEAAPPGPPAPPSSPA